MSKKIGIVLFVVMSFQLHVFSEVTFKMWDAIRKNKLIEQYSLEEPLSTYLSLVSREVSNIERSLGFGVKLKTLKDFSPKETEEQCESILFYSSRFEDAYLVYLISEKCNFKELKKTSAAAIVARAIGTVSKRGLPPSFTFDDSYNIVVLEVSHLYKKGPKIGSHVLRFSRGGVDHTISIDSMSKGTHSRVTQARTEERGYAYSKTYDFNNLSTIGHCLNILADFRGISKPLTIKYTSSKNNRNLDPLDTLIRLDGVLTKKDLGGDYTYFGDINPQGEVLKWGYLRDLYSEGMKGQTIILSPEYFDQILDLTRIYGKTVILDNHFFGVANLTQALAIQYGVDKGFDDAKRTLTALIKSLNSRITRPDKVSILRQLEGILKKYPNYLSAKALQRVVQGRLPVKISYQSSYIEASYYARLVINRELSRVKDVMAALKALGKIKKLIHRDFVNMLLYSEKALKDTITLSGTKKTVATAKKGTLSTGVNQWKKLNQSIYRSLRLIRYEREKILDKQENVERLY